MSSAPKTKAVACISGSTVNVVLRPGQTTRIRVGFWGEAPYPDDELVDVCKRVVYGLGARISILG